MHSFGPLPSLLVEQEYFYSRTGSHPNSTFDGLPTSIGFSRPPGILTLSGTLRRNRAHPSLAANENHNAFDVNSFVNEY
jgi:hypothetical protein